MRTDTKKRCPTWKISLLIALVAGLAGCEDQTQEVNASSSFSLPKLINPRALPFTVTATATIEELGKDIPLAIGDESMTGSFDSLPAGTYTVMIKLSSPRDEITLALAEQEVVYGGATQSVAFSEDSYRYPDDDGDHYTNLNELIANHSPTDGNDIPLPRKMFVTSVTGPGSLSAWADAGGESGLLAGDRICQTRADAASLPGTYRAWLSDQHDDAYCRVAELSGKKGSSSCEFDGRDLGPYIRTDGFPVAENLNSLLEDGQMFSAIKFDEGGNELAEQHLYTWTGTDNEGVYHSSFDDCSDWSSSEVSETGGFGRGDSTSYSWTDSWHISCEATLRLYCLQVSYGEAVLPAYETENAKKVFVSSASGSGDLSSWSNSGGKSGLAAGDEVCKSLASQANVENADKFTAWLSDSTHDAIDNLQGSGPWARPDGVLVARDKSDLLDGSLFTAIAQTEQGSYVNEITWTGTQITGDCPDCDLSTNCEDWTNSSSAQFGKRGKSASTYLLWTDADSIWKANCDEQYRIYCLEGD